MSTIDTKWISAGKAIFTVSNPTGERYTFKVTKSREQEGRPTVFFGSYLTGSDNENDYSYLGLVDPLAASLKLTKASRLPVTSKPVAVLSWVLKIAAGQKQLPEGYELRHAGRCCRCGRTLTVPESIDSGIGPECASRMGL